VEKERILHSKRPIENKNLILNSWSHLNRTSHLRGL